MKIGASKNVVFVDFQHRLEEEECWIAATTEAERDWADKLQTQLDRAVASAAEVARENRELQFILFDDPQLRLVSDLPDDAA